MKHPELEPAGYSPGVCRSSTFPRVPRHVPPPIADTASGAASGPKLSPLVPLPDFFGAHAQLAGWPLATGDPDRIRTYFPEVAA